MTRIVMLIVLAALIALGGWWLWRERTIDVCNANSGQWNYSTSHCDRLLY